MPKYVVVGNSAGGIGAVEALRDVDASGSLAVVSDEPCVAYSRPAIAEVLAGTKTVRQIAYRDETFYSRMNVETYFGRPVQQIDAAGRTIKLADGEVLTFEKLLLATGGTPIQPPMEGSDKEGVYRFTTVADALSVRQRVNAVGNRVVVIGGGLIGVACADALARIGARVAMVELRDRVLGLLLDEEGSKLARRAVDAAGIEVLCQCTVKRVVGRPEDERSVGGVVLDNGREIPCDAVVVAVGVRPRLQLASAAGIAVNRGIVVDRRMETSVSGIYACGDVAEAYDFVVGGNRVVPIWPGAFLGGRTAGFNMAGVPALSTDFTAMNSLKYFGLSLVSAGEINVDGQPGYLVLRRSEPDRGFYRKVVLKDSRVVGFIFAGRIERSGIVYALLRGQVKVESFADRLLEDNFDLIDLPQELRSSHYRTATTQEGRRPAAAGPLGPTLAAAATPGRNGGHDVGS